jgi:UPF0755 protein
LFALASLYFTAKVLNASPATFPTNTDIRIEEGMTQKDIAQLLETHNVIRSALFFDLILHFEHERALIPAGVYTFPDTFSTYDIATHITNGEFRKPLMRVTFPEGFRVEDMFTILPSSIVASSSLSVAEYEGYLFPDTYFISRNATLAEILTQLRATFDEKIAPYTEQISASGFTHDEVVILASLIEREAKDTESKRMISGILQNRLNQNMPLQVDAVFDYLLHKSSAELTLDDMKIDSPYNTYTHTGLPPAPIANPGLASIEAVLHPTLSEYFYYLTGTDGTFHYATTFDEHKKNKATYLKD